MNQHTLYLRHALSLASSRRGYCAPNPAVGAVIVRDGAIIGEGCHWARGQPHAEVVALHSLKAAAVGATLYVTLEPCCHFGLTPPCTQAILEAGITMVVYGYRDPNPIVAGEGHRVLAESGVHVVHWNLDEIDHFYNSYRYWQHYGRPWITAKIALSLDGKIAGPHGQRVAITGPELKQYTAECRQRSDAILTTAKTILKDDPFLGVQKGTARESKPLYILDRRLQLTSNYQIWQNTASITVFYSASNSGKISAELLDRGVVFVPITESGERLNLEAVFQYIGQDGKHDCWVEAGGILLTSLIESALAHELQVYCAPKWLGPEAQSAFGENAISFEGFAQKQWFSKGEDVVCKMTRVPGITEQTDTIMSTASRTARISAEHSPTAAATVIQTEDSRG